MRLLIYPAVTACALFQIALAAAADPPPQTVTYSLDAALGGGIVAMGSDAETLLKNLAGLEANAPEELERWIAQLGSDSFASRESATRELFKLMGTHPSAVIPRLQQAAESGEPEVRNRCKQLLGLSPPQMIDGLIEWIYLKRIPGMLEFFEGLPAATWNDARRLRLPEVIERVAVEDDRPRLLEWAGHELPPFRQASLRALAKLGGDPALAALADDPQALVRLELAIHWGKLSDARCVPLLQSLVGEEDFQINSISAYALQRLTGEYFGFPGTATPEGREQIARSWRELEIGEAKFPLDLPSSLVSNEPSGHKLFLLEEGVGLLRTYDENGQLIATQEPMFNSSANDVIPMDDGEVLLCGENLDESYGWYISKRDNTQVVRKSLRNSYPCPTLISNGNLLICEQRRAYETDPRDALVLNLNLDGHSGRNSWRTHYGTTLVAVSQAIFEFDVNGELVWRHDFDTDFVTICQGLRNGNVLVILRRSNRIIELTHDHRIAWEWRPAKGTVRDSFMLPSGNLLATTDAGAMEVSRGKHLLWEIEEEGIWQVRRGE